MQPSIDTQQQTSSQHVVKSIVAATDIAALALAAYYGVQLTRKSHAIQEANARIFQSGIVTDADRELLGEDNARSALEWARNYGPRALKRD